MAICADGGSTLSFNMENLDDGRISFGLLLKAIAYIVRVGPNRRQDSAAQRFLEEMAGLIPAFFLAASQ
jgi:hypothetical protein